MQRITGTFEPPRDIEGLRLYRLLGPGCLDISTLGIGVSGTAVDRPVRFDARLVAVGLILGGSILAIGLGRTGQIMPVAVVSAMLLWMWQSWKEAEKIVLRWTVPWPSVESIVQLPQHPDRFAVILSGDAAHPETVYFTPTNGPDELLQALREHAPNVRVDTEAAALAAFEEANAPPVDEDADDDSPWVMRS